MTGCCEKCGFSFENPPDAYKEAWPNWRSMMQILPGAVTIVCTCGHEIPVERLNVEPVAG